jgi:hypothetical protein
VPVPSPQQSPSRRSALLRGSAGAAACGLVIGAVALPVTGVWPGTEQRAVPPQIAGMPDDSGLALMAPGTTATVVKHTKKKKAAHHAWEVQATGSQIVVRPSEGTVPAAESTPVVPNDTAAAKTPAATKKTPKPVGHEVVTSGGPLPATSIVPAPAAAASAAGLVRLSVRSAGVADNANGDPELQVKLGIAGGQPTDALPESVTLHLRPTVPAALPKDDPSLSLKATVDMVEAPRATPNDPALRMRVRMNIAQAPTDTPMIQEPSTGGDGKSNVIALTVGLTQFQTPDDEPGHGTPGEPDPGQPSQPGDPGSGSPSGGPTTPGDSGPGGGMPAPSDPGPTEPAYPAPAPSDPSPAPSEPTPAPSDPAPAPSDPAPVPTEPAPTPAPSDPAPAPADPAPAPAPSDPAALPATEILIPVGPVRPIGGTTSIPVPPAAGDSPVPDSIPIEVIVEELPPSDPAPATDPADVPITVVQAPAAEVPGPPADATADPSAAPDASAPATDSAVVASYDGTGGTAASGT